MWMLYGANGYTGKLIAELACARGDRPVLAGRDERAISALAGRLGLEHRIFSLTDSAAAARALRDVEVVAHCAGPFSVTSAPVVELCLRHGTHYLDITGEIDVFEAVFRRHAEAERAGVVLLPGSGFDVVPTDCLAAMVAAELPEATRLDLAFFAPGGISAGTAKSMWEGLATGGRTRVDGALRSTALGEHRRSVPFPSAVRRVSSLPWGDVSTAFRSTGIPTITTYAHLPALRLLPRSRLVSTALGRASVQRLGNSVIGAALDGPGRRRRARSWSEVFAEARDERGRSVAAALIGPGTYDLTADAVLRSVSALRRGDVRPGAHTPSTAFGADFVRRLHGVKVVEPAEHSA